MNESTSNIRVTGGTPEVAAIPAQVIAAGREVSIDFSQFVSPAPGETLSYAIRNFPEKLSIDAASGMLTGIAPDVELSEEHTVMLDVVSKLSGKTTTSIFKLEILGGILLETPEARAFFGDEPVNFWDTTASWEIRQFIQQLLNEHFVWVYVYDAENPPMESGKLLQLRKAKTGWNIYLFENIILINPGDKAFEQYGNRGRLLNTLREMYQTDLPAKKWKEIAVDGSDMDNIGRAWIIARQLNLPIAEEAPSDIARIIYANVQRLYSQFTGTKYKPNYSS